MKLLIEDSLYTPQQLLECVHHLMRLLNTDNEEVYQERVTDFLVPSSLIHFCFEQLGPDKVNVQASIVHYLLFYCAEIAEKDLQKARRLPAVIEFFLQHGADPNAAIEDPFADTLLHIATRFKNLELRLVIVKLLLNYQANPNIENNERHSPLYDLFSIKHLSMYEHDKEIQDMCLPTARVLIEHGAILSDRLKSTFKEDKDLAILLLEQQVRDLTLELQQKEDTIAQLQEQLPESDTSHSPTFFQCSR